jgi:hypothetical protein
VDADSLHILCLFKVFQLNLNSYFLLLNAVTTTRRTQTGNLAHHIHCNAGMCNKDAALCLNLTQSSIVSISDCNLRQPVLEFLLEIFFLSNET